MTATANLSIGEVAEQAGVLASKIRYYESVGVLPPPERSGGQRRYGPRAIQRLQVIAVAQQAGFTLGEIGELLRRSESGQASQELQTLARRKLPEVTALIGRAESMKSWLEVASGCDCSTLDLCGLFEEAGDETGERDPQPLDVIRAGGAARANQNARADKVLRRAPAC